MEPANKIPIPKIPALFDSYEDDPDKLKAALFYMALATVFSQQRGRALTTEELRRVLNPSEMLLRHQIAQWEQECPFLFDQQRGGGA